MNERGSVTFWVLGLAGCVLTVGVLSVDLWNLMAHRRELAAIADSAAVAGASAIDEAEWRSGRGVRLDPAMAEQRAGEAVAAHAEVIGTIDRAPGWIDVDPAAGTVRVTLARSVDTALLGLAGRDSVTIGASSEATAIRR